MNHDPELVDKLAETLCNRRWVDTGERWETYHSLLAHGLPADKMCAIALIAHFRETAIAALDIAVPFIERRVIEALAEEAK